MAAIDLLFHCLLFTHQILSGCFCCLKTFFSILSLQGTVQFGTLLEAKSSAWSEQVPFPSASPSNSRRATTNDTDDSLSVPVAFLLRSGEIRGARWSITSRTFRGIEVISIGQRFQIINNVGRPLVVHPVLISPGKKVFYY